MSLSNTSTAYGGLTRFFHWAIALGIAIMVPLGWTAHLWPMQEAAQIATKTTLFSAHKTLGVGLFAIALARIVWALGQTRPVPLHPERRAETLLAETVHWALYAALVIVPLTGWIEHAATEGFAPIWWPLGQNLPMVPTAPAVAETFATVHFLSQWLLVGMLALHVTGAIRHAAIDRDATLARMVRGTPGGNPAVRTSHAAPAALALLAWVALFGGAAAAGLLGTNATRPAAHLKPAVSDWQIQDGTLAIRVTQMGAQVTGSFADWTAAIAWQPRDTPGPEGDVTVRISVPSLTLGSVSKQALGPDFLAADSFPTATFAATLLRTETGREAQGTLTLKDAELPITLPFDLTLDGDTARMTGQATLDRRDYAVGTGMTDPGQLAYDVEVLVDLVATRAAR
ncbi:cytochrome [Salipiger aestuarii]|uniref:cytochrome b/b6 domain-containing protein n=1 Tax=Salipiger aestuarii TaxID=568098 RepID=UPI00025B8366|nr:cytochrome b/b6 domain-containing protein [Salipiger aestuarii]EIE52010.1 cytochrome, putative [Citreicella sp. 357]KAA8606362.1 cytochrome [Salipiger aestuarii]